MVCLPRTHHAASLPRRYDNLVSSGLKSLGRFLMLPPDVRTQAAKGLDREPGIIKHQEREKQRHVDHRRQEKATRPLVGTLSCDLDPEIEECNAEQEGSHEIDFSGHV